MSHYPKTGSRAVPETVELTTTPRQCPSGHFHSVHACLDPKKLLCCHLHRKPFGATFLPACSRGLCFPHPARAWKSNSQRQRRNLGFDCNGEQPKRTIA